MEVTETESEVSVACDDGSTYHGAILAGTDGVRSLVRREMWRIADEKVPGFIPSSDKSAMHAEYRCMFGITTPAKLGVPRGSQLVTYDKDLSSITIFGKDNVIYFFLFEKLDRIYGTDEIPHYSEADAERYAKKYASFPIHEGGNGWSKITFGDLWKIRKSSRLVPLEEAQYKRWTFGRIALLGDAIHKGTPNSGPGGNNAIESAAALANELYRLLQEKRKVPAYGHLDIGKTFTKLQALYSWPHKIAAMYAINLWENASVEMFSDQFQNAPKINYLPTPAKSLTGWMPFNEQQGAGMKESILRRVLHGALIFAVLTVCDYLMPMIWSSGEMTAAAELGKQLNMAVVYAIMLLDSTRRLANASTPIA